MSHKDDMLRIDDLTVAYRGGYRALDGVSLRVGCDESVALVGESGCGKSTTLRAVLGLLPGRASVTGSIEVDGVPLSGLGKRDRAAARARVGYVTQDPFSAYDPLRTVRHHVLEPLRARGESIDEDAVLERIEAAGVPQAGARWRQHPHQWSGGMLQRADIIAATLLNPLVTLADEPTSALDADLADDMMRLLRRSSRGLLFVTHDLDLAARHADRIVVLDAGRVVEEGAPAALLREPTARQTVRLVESARARFEGGKTPFKNRQRSMENVAPATESTSIDSTRAGGDAGPVSADEVARLDGVSKRYATRDGVHAAVADVSLRVCAGEIVGICGRSGSGKSTLLRLLGGLEEPDSGSATRGGPGSVLPIFQDPVASLDGRWPIWRSITEPVSPAARRAGRRPPPAARRRELARAALADVGLGGIDEQTYPGGLSVGQCQRVAIARAVCAGPEVVIADEPTASLDVTTGTEIADLLLRLRAEGTALVIVSHDVGFLRLVADRILRMSDGRLAELSDDAGSRRPESGGVGSGRAESDGVHEAADRGRLEVGHGHVEAGPGYEDAGRGHAGEPA